MSPDDLGVLLAAHCRHATTELPPGEPGVRWAADFLAVLPEACGRRLPDLLTTGPKLFEFFVGYGLFAAMPSPRLVPLVLGLVARVSPLLRARSARQWALWLARVWDSGSPLLTAIRKRTPAHLIGIQAPAPAGPPLRSARIRDERDRLVADLAIMATENGRLQTLLIEAREDHDRLAAELAGVVVREQRVVAAAAAERDRLAGELAAVTEQLRQASRNAAHDAVRLQQSQARMDGLTAEIAGVRAQCERMSGALALAEAMAQQRVSEHELMARMLAAERLTSEQLRDEVAELRRPLEAARGPTEAAPRVIKPLDVLRATITGFQTVRMRRAAVATGLHPDHDLLAEAEDARRRADAVADALRVENAELRSERDTLRTRCNDPAAGPTWAAADVEQLTRVQAELAEVRREAERLTELLNRKRELVRALQKAKDAQEIELAAANAEVASRKAGASGLLSVALAREHAMQAVREAQAGPPVEGDD
ncbi:MAG: hypothetical protein JNL82_08890 [Myxococcales bacterium]|nr:hypothetical protein [Myxococcales bacterium]